MAILSEPTVKVGILESDSISVTLHGWFTDDSGRKVTGKLQITAPTELHPSEPECRFTLHDVKIGIGFHWEQKMDQIFEGSISIIAMPSGKLMAVNRIEVEKYLRSVIGSEMNADAPLEFLKTHAVISRSWLLAQIQHKTQHRTAEITENEHERIKWYDHDDHELFDVCADDHCQRYQGVRPDMPQSVTVAVKATCGEVLVDGEDLCDARFSKCCGGVMERFSTCWGNEDKSYLVAKRDTANPEPLPDLTNEEMADKWCRTAPDAWCAAPSKELLARVLNGYDLHTPDFYRWKVEYTAEELAQIVHDRSGVDFGKIISIMPLHRGPSARIDRLEIKGSKHTMVMGKELEIRRTLSTSHLYSSAFVVDALDIDESGVPQRWVITGAGWGHGVGLCQIGAAAMADAGKEYKQILSHYYPGAQLKKLY